MIDIDHPDAPYIFAASRHLDEIKQSCLAASAQRRDGRRQTRRRIESNFAALRWLNAH